LIQLEFWSKSMNRNEKVELVASLHQTLSETACVVVTQQVGMNVDEVEQLRSAMREAGTNYKVTKNRLARLALKGTQYEGLDQSFSGPTAIATSDDPVATVKAAVKFAKENEKFSIVTGSIEGSMLSMEELKRLAELPSFDELRAKIVGLLKTPAMNLVGILPASGGKVARVVGARGQQT
jgi:large subunit ribosomal protein L10